MKKIIALVLFVSTAVSFTACSNDDGPIKVEGDYIGTWETQSVSYNGPGDFMDYDKIIHAPGNSIDVTPAKEIITISNNNTVTFKNYLTSGTLVTEKEGELTKVSNDKFEYLITFSDKETREVLKLTKKNEMIMHYDYTVIIGEKPATLPLTVKYKRIK